MLGSPKVGGALQKEREEDLLGEESDGACGPPLVVCLSAKREILFVPLRSLLWTPHQGGDREGEREREKERERVAQGVSCYRAMHPRDYLPLGSSFLLVWRRARLGDAWYRRPLLPLSPVILSSPIGSVAYPPHPPTPPPGSPHPFPSLPPPRVISSDCCCWWWWWWCGVEVVVVLKSSKCFPHKPWILSKGGWSGDIGG